jgi:hypothetical protein
MNLIFVLILLNYLFEFYATKQNRFIKFNWMVGLRKI